MAFGCVADEPTSSSRRARRQISSYRVANPERRLDREQHGFGLLLLIALAPRLVRTAFDGFVLGAFLGLGFEILEDISYGLNSGASQRGANQVDASLGTAVVLADALAADHGAQTPRVNFARSEVARLRDGRPPAPK